MSIQLCIPGSDHRPVRGDLHRALVPPGRADAPLVICVHGFKGFRAWGFWPHICDRLAAAGLHALRLDYSHNGVERSDFDRLDLFAIDTWTRHQEDLHAVIEAVHAPLGAIATVIDEAGAPRESGGASWPWGASPRAIGLLGHSRGGADVILHAAHEPRVRAVAAMAPVAHLTRGFEDESALREFGYFPVPNSRTNQIMPVARTQVDDARRYDVLDSAARIAPRPLLVVHGEGDDAVPISDGEEIVAAHGATTLHRIAGAGHTFGAAHPWAGMPAALDELLRVVGAFFVRLPE